MNSRELKFEKDPYLKKSDPSQRSASNTDNRWTEAMKGVPSYSEHMKQMEAGKSSGTNAFTQAAEKKQYPLNRTNAFSKTNTTKQSRLQTASNKAYSTSISQTANKGVTRSDNRSK